LEFLPRTYRIFLYQLYHAFYLLLKEIYYNLEKYIFDNFDDFKTILENKGGFISAYWDGTDETENKIKDLTKATIRCIPDGEHKSGKCVFSGKPSSQRVLFAKAY